MIETTILEGDVMPSLHGMAAESFACVVTSPPYWGLRDYGVDGQIGLEPTLDAYVETMRDVARGLWRVLKPEGTFWLNLGDCYAGGGREVTKRAKDTVGVERPTKNGVCERCGKPFFGGYRRRFCSSYCGGSDNSKRAERPGGLKPKDLCGVPWRVAFALQADGWWLRSAIVWHKPNPMPESVRDRPTSAYEMVFLLTKGATYFYDADASKEPAVAAHEGEMDGGAQRAVDGSNANDGRNFREGNKQDQTGASSLGSSYRRMTGFNARWDAAEKAGPKFTRNARNVWTIAPRPYRGAHFATMPVDLAERCIKAGCPPTGRVLDPFGGAGTTAIAANLLGRSATLIELNPAYAALARARIDETREKAFAALCA